MMPDPVERALHSCRAAGPRLAYSAAMSLDYLIFDYSDSTDGTGTFEAMVSVGPQHVPAVHAEVAAVLAWCHARFGSDCGPVGEGFTWDAELQGQQEFSAREDLHFDVATGRLSARLMPPGTPRHTLTLTLTGDEAFCEALRSHFALD
jgi:hypothetical protein